MYGFEEVVAVDVTLNLRSRVAISFEVDGFVEYLAGVESRIVKPFRVARLNEESALNSASGSWKQGYYVGTTGAVSEEDVQWYIESTVH